MQTLTLAERITESEKSIEALNFGATLGPVFDEQGRALQNFRRVFRPDTERTLAVVSDKYRLIQHRDALMPALEVLGGDGWEIRKSRVEAYGSRAFVEMIRFDNAVKVGPDQVGERILLSNSYDRTGSLVFAMGAVVFVCLNGLIVPGTGGFGFRARHVGDTPERLEFMIGSINKIQKGLSSRLLETYSSLDKRVPDEVGGEIVRRVIGERNWLQAYGYWRGGTGRNGESTAWNLYNGITQYLTHDYSGGWGLRERHNAKAFDLISRWIKDGVLPKEEING